MHTSPLNRKTSHIAYLDMISTQARPSERVPFTVVPKRVDANKLALAPGVKPWRITLTPAGDTAQPLALELQGDVVVGSNPEMDEGLDVNVSHWQGYRRGVSRRHVLLRPNRDKLFILDLRSTNGTNINGLPLGVGWAYALQDGDLISLGRLHLKLRIVQRPGEDA
jgi:pSer/pThr/pTyr-binding forkhead associated (FHA) protein